MKNFMNLFDMNDAPRIDWLNLIKNDLPRQQFLISLIPLMEHVYSVLLPVLEEKLPVKYSPDLLTRLIYSDFSINVNPMLLRVAVLEMHIAKRQKILKGKTSKKRFEYFAQILSHPDNIRDLLTKYSVLKKQIEIHLEEMITVYQQFFERFVTDYDEIMRVFFKEETGYRLENMQISGDRHEQGHVVMILHLSKGKKRSKLVYKPRSLKIDLCFQALLEWFNQFCPEQPLLTINMLDKKAYGWSEYLSYVPCKFQREIKQFYFQTGILMTLFYALRGDDIHCENLIAHGSHPAIIDYECLIKPFISFSIPKPLHPPVFLVNHTHFLPQMMIPKQKGLINNGSAIGSDEDEETGLEWIFWQDEGKDTMHAQRKPILSQQEANKPILNGKRVNFLDYQQELIKGFSFAYQTLLYNDLPIHLFKDARIRVVIRDTVFYARLLSESWHPRLLFSEVAFKKHILKIKPSNLKIPKFNTVIVSECDDLFQSNIPLFTCKTTGKMLYDSRKRKLKGLILKSGYDTVVDHLKSLNQSDYLLQKRLIEESLYVAELNKKLLNKHKFQGFLNKRVPLLSEADIKKKSIHIAKRILDKIVSLSFELDQHPYWLTVSFKQKMGYLELFDMGLYEGVLGISLSLAYGGRLLNDSTYTNLAKKAISKVLEDFRQDETNFPENESLGAYEGIGGVLYTLSSFYRIWGKTDQNILYMLKKLLKGLPDIIKQSKEFDIISGLSGLILVLNSLDDLVSESDLKPLLTSAMRRLLILYPHPSILPKENPHDNKQPLLGFSHGVSGVLFALQQYHLRYPSRRVKKWISDGLAYEEAEFNDSKSNWPDFRGDSYWNAKKSKSKSKLKFMTAWCHGAPGIGLGRLGMLSTSPDKKVRTNLERDVYRALHSTQKGFYNHEHCLCHGNLGNLDLFLKASHYFSDPKIHLTYQRLASAELKSLDEKDFIYSSKFKNEVNPGLLSGGAGIAYQLLRMAYPNEVPSILLLERLQK